MKAVTNDYKNNIKTLGRQLDDKLYYTKDNETIYISSEQLNSITPRFKSNLLKSTMKELELDSNIDIPIGTILTYQSGVKVGDVYEYINYGNFIVKSAEKAENNNSYIIQCYDKMLYAMTDYVDLGITYPITIRDYINTICTHLGLTFKNANEEFTNYDKQITEELYLDTDKNSIGYTFRDVLDELAQATASTICINNNDELEIRYVNDLINSTASVEGTTITIPDNDYDKVQDLQLYGNTSQNGTPTPSTPVPINVVTGRQEILCAGKNIFDKSQSAIIRVSSSYAELENGVRSTLTATGTNKYIGIRVGGKELLGKQLTVSSTITPSGTNTGRIRFYFINGSTTTGGISGSTLTATGSTTFTIPNQFSSETDDGIAILLDSNRNGTNVNVGDYVDYTNLQIEIGNQATNYEPYIGKTYEIDLGKNLIYNKNGTASGEYGGVQYTFNEDGSVKVKGTATSNYNFYLMSGNNSLVLEPGTYTLSGGISNRAWVRAYDGTNYQDTTSNNIKTFTVTQRSTFAIVLRIQNGQAVDDTFYPMLEKGSIATAYRKHKEPIELCKIDTYEDSIKKATGKNLFSSAMELGAIDNTTGETLTNNNGIRTQDYITVKPNTTYTIWNDRNYRVLIHEYGENNDYIQYTGNFANPKTFTTTANTHYIKVRSAVSNVENNLNTKYMLLDGTYTSQTIPTYEPYGTGWYIEKQIGKVVLDGSETISISNSGTSNWFYSITKATGINNDSTPSQNNALCNFYLIASVGNSNTNEGIYILKSGSIRIRYGTEDTVSNFKTWLSSHNVSVYYVLSNPTYTFIEDEELINQLENIRLLEGLNNIIVSSSDLSSPVKLTYVDDYETIDEEYLRDVNVSFKDKPVIINAITLIKNIDSDAISMRDDESVEQNGLYDLQIRDNQILSGEDRQDYLEEIFNKLNGLTYFTNDFTSTGVTYLELCDRYKVKVRDKIYYCIMFNDEVVRTTGLVEYINTEDLEYVKTNYVKIRKSIKKETQTYVRLDEQAHEIELKASKDEIISTINLSPEQIEINSNKISLAGKTIDMTSDNITINSNNFSVDANGDLTAHSATLEDIEIKDGQIYIPIVVDYDYTMADYQRALDIYLEIIQPTQEDLDKYDVNGDGQIDLTDVMTILKLIRTGLSHSNPGKIIFKADGANSKISIINSLNQDIVKFDFNGIRVTDLDNNVTTIGAGSIGMRQGTNIIANLFPEILYDDATGTQGTITLNLSANTFRYLEIYYYKNIQEKQYNSVKVYEPDGKNVVLQTTWYGLASGSGADAMYTYREKITISGNSITRGEMGATAIYTTGQCSAWQPDEMYITRIIGYR